MYNIEVYTGGDDFAFERDRFLWRVWIHENVTTTGFKVSAHFTNAERAIVHFDDPEYLSLFALTKPEYVTSDHIKHPGAYTWDLGDSGPLQSNK